MRRSLIRLACMWLMTTLALAARADTLATIDDLDPADGSELTVGASLHVRIAYQSEEAVSLWARPFRNGAEVKQAISNASEKYSGSGQALGWFALTEAGSIDEIRILAGGGSPYRQWVVASRPVSVTWGAGASPQSAESDWVGELQSAADTRSAERARQRASEPVPAGDIALFSGFMLLVVALLLGSIALPVVSVWKWRGGWRAAAVIPLALMGFVVLRIVIDTTRDPTSHNLWPFEILMFGAVAIAIVGALKLARMILGVKTEPLATSAKGS